MCPSARPWSQLLFGRQPWVGMTPEGKQEGSHSGMSLAECVLNVLLSLKEKEQRHVPGDSGRPGCSWA